MTRRALCLASLLLLVACDPGKDKPAEPVWGKQACAHCAMLVTEKPFSAQATLKDGTRRYFDDVGCLVGYLEREGASVQKSWVRAASGDGWTVAAEARFAPGATTPMDYGFVAAAEGASWDEVRAAVLARLRDNERKAP